MVKGTDNIKECREYLDMLRKIILALSERYQERDVINALECLRVSIYRLSQEIEKLKRGN